MSRKTKHSQPHRDRPSQKQRPLLPLQVRTLDHVKCVVADAEIPPRHTPDKAQKDKRAAAPVSAAEEAHQESRSLSFTHVLVLVHTSPALFYTQCRNFIGRSPRRIRSG
nr:hypothetical protein CFP56_67705 [Quercus suber]